jgi:hypothetical protein
MFSGYATNVAKRSSRSVSILAVLLFYFKSVKAKNLYNPD